MNGWYYAGGDGTRFCFAKEPSFVCPNGRSLWDCHDLATGEVTVVERQAGERMGITFTRHVTDAQRRAAAELGMDPECLASLILRGHSSNWGRRRVDGKLTDQCKACGTKMERLGFRCWIEHDKAAEDYGTGDRITETLGGTPSITTKSFYLDTKKEARSWAIEESRISKSAHTD